MNHRGRGISIHALREEGDIHPAAPCLWKVHFYPRPPRGGRHGRTEHGTDYHLISIHALREEGDQLRPDNGKEDKIFLSTPSARRATSTRRFRPTRMATFLSTPSARRATRQDGGHHARQHISIHALREEGDAVPPCPISPSWTFLSTPSARRATVLPAPSSAAPFWHFYPRPPRGGRPIVHTDTRDAKNFYPRPPRGGRRRPRR